MTALRVKITNYIEICNPQDLPLSAETELLRSLTYTNPEIEMKRRLGIWVGNTPRTLTLFRYKFHSHSVGLNGEENPLYIDRGCWRLLKDIANKYELSLQIEDCRVSEEVPDMPDFTEGLEDYQRNTVESIINGKHQGIICFPTGGGKTRTATALIAALKQRTVVFVHTNELLRQWIEVMKGLLPGIKIDYWAGQHKKIGEHVTVSMLQTASKGIPEDVIAKFGLVIQDECHHSPAETFRRVINQFPAKYRYGLTATPRRRDGKSFYIKSTFGDVLAELGYKDVGARIVMPRIVVVPTVLAEDYTKCYRANNMTGGMVLDYTLLFNLMAKDYMRNMQILQIILECLEENDTYTLVLTKRRENAKTLHEFLSGQGVLVELLLGGGGEKERRRKDEALEKTRRGENRVLIGTSVADEGLDVVNLNRVILATPTSWYGSLQQRIGRAMRNHDGKRTPIIYDLVDTDIPECVDSWRARKRFYNAHEFDMDYSKCSGTILEEKKQ